MAATLPNSIRIDDLRGAALTATLRRCPLFAELPSADLAAVAECCTLKSLQKGELLFREGETAEGFYVVHSGRISISRLTPDGREQIICLFNPPESFAEVTLATVETYPANATALEHSQVILVRKTPFRRLVAQKPELSLQMLSSMSLHLKHLVQLLQDLKGRQIEARLADWLLQQSPAARAGCPALFELPVTKKVLAGQLGVTSETLSRTLARFRDENLIKVDGPRVTIINGPGLQAYLNGTA